MQYANIDELETLAEECIRHYDEGGIDELIEELINDEPVDITDCEIDTYIADLVSTETGDVSECDEETYDDDLYDSLFYWCVNNPQTANEFLRA